MAEEKKEEKEKKEKKEKKDKQYNVYEEGKKKKGILSRVFGTGLIGKAKEGLKKKREREEKYLKF